jgi:hypothetical protein
MGLIASTACPGVPAWAKTHEVECGSGGAALQLAIDQARDGDRLNIRGICREAVQIVDRKLTLTGTPGAALEAPDYPWTALPHSTLHPVVLAVRSRVRIEGLSIDGRLRAGDPWASGLTGILLLNSRANLVRNRIVRVRHAEHRSDWEVSALRVIRRPGPEEAGAIRIEENLIEDFESNGILIQNTESDPEASMLRLVISRNRIRGAGAMIQNQNGIQIGGLQDGGTAPIRARVEENTFEGIFSFSGIWSSSGIWVTPLVFPDRILARPYTLECEGNVFDRSNTGISVTTQTSAKITANTIQNGDTGIRIEGPEIRLRGNRLSNLETGVWAVDSDLTPDQLHHRYTSRVFQNLLRTSSRSTQDLPGRGAPGKNR